MNPIILSHGGVGAAVEFSDGCEKACLAAKNCLTDGVPDAALRAVVEAGMMLEDDPRLNAGTGANKRIDGSIQQDAIVAASDGRIGSVAAIDSTRNPIRVAREVMDSPHIMLVGEGATSFARERGYPWADCSTPEAEKKYQEAMERLKAGKLLDCEKVWQGTGMHGTIGAVARASDGTFATSCSTGGTSLMLPGRVGDTPIFGAGVMVGPAGAVSATGDGEEIMRRLTSMRIYQRLERGESAQDAVDAEVAEFPEPYVLGLIVVGREDHGVAATRNHMPWFALEI